MKRIHFISDLHLGGEHADDAAVQAYCAYSRRYRPDFRVWGGDILELASCNSRGAEGDLATELATARASIERILKEARPAKESDDWVSGNHEARYIRQLRQFVPAVASALPSIDQLLGIAELGFGSFTDFKGTLMREGVLFTHGTYAGATHAGTVLRKYPGVCVVYGHTHTPQSAGAPFFATDGGRWAVGAGALRTLDPHWAPGPTGWTSGFVEVLVDGEVATPLSYVMQNARFIGADGNSYGPR